MTSRQPIPRMFPHRRASAGGAVARRRVPACLAVICVASLVAAVPANAETLFTDGFESGDFESWSLMKTSGAGVAALQSQEVRTGAVAAELSNAGSAAYMRKRLAPPQRDLTATGTFRVAAQGGGSAAFLSLLATGSKRVVSVYRDPTAGQIMVADGANVFPTSGALPLDTWGEIAVHAVVAGEASTVEVRLNGTLIFQTTCASLGSARIKTVQLGNDIPAQEGTVVADDIVVGNASPSSLGGEGR
jgi:hypothetical protein